MIINGKFLVNNILISYGRGKREGIFYGNLKNEETEG